MGGAKMNTRARIIETALGLFNTHGSGEISTNHIAQALGISPGNLYYHFRNKEEIIRAIAEQKDARWEALYHLPHDRTPTLADIERLVRENFALVWDYRFFFRELSALTQRDPLLKAHYQQLRRERLVAFEGLFAQFVSAGVARQPASPSLVANLAKLCWLISDYWLPFLEIDGDLTLPDGIEQGVALYLQVLDPYVSDAGEVRAIHASAAGASSGRAPQQHGIRKEG
jgi:AcrR family transcriptional regulator